MPKRKADSWKTVELDEKGMEEFFTGGGFTIEELSEGEQAHLLLANNKAPGISEKTAKKAKTKQKKAVMAAIDQPASTESTQAVEGDAEVAALDMSRWEALGLHPKLISTLAKLRFETPTTIQALSIPEALQSNKDVIAAAETGSGKTLAFGLPIISKILSSREVSSEPQTHALIVLPTRELAMQVKTHLTAACPSLSSAVVVGGLSIEKQTRLLKRKPDVVIGTPGRLAGVLGLATAKPADDLSEGKAQLVPEFRDALAGLKFLVLDEADRLCEEGHFRDLEGVLSLIYSSVKTPPQTFVFSATLATESEELSSLTRIVKLQRESMRCVVDVSKTQQQKRSLPEGLKFEVVPLLDEKDREILLTHRILAHFFGNTTSSSQATTKLVIFVNAVTYVYRLTSLLRTFLPTIRVVGLHSAVKQKERLARMDQFKKAPRSVLIATDLAARGLDLANIDLVVHLQPPRESDLLVHRSGRTARAGKQGTVAMIVAPKEIPKWRKVFWHACNQEINEVAKFLPDQADVGRARELLEVASRIESANHHLSKKNKEQAWRKKAADDLDIELSSEDADDDDADDDDDSLEDGKKESGSVAVDRLELKRLLQVPLPSLVKRNKFKL